MTNICKDLIRGFLRDCPSGKLDKETVADTYKKILTDVDPLLFVDQLFRVLDSDESGFIDFKEFMLAVDMSLRGTSEDKLAWAFKLFDRDSSGGYKSRGKVC